MSSPPPVNPGDPPAPPPADDAKLSLAEEKTVSASAAVFGGGRGRSAERSLRGRAGRLSSADRHAAAAARRAEAKEAERGQTAAAGDAEMEAAIRAERQAKAEADEKGQLEKAESLITTSLALLVSTERASASREMTQMCCAHVLGALLQIQKQGSHGGSTQEQDSSSKLLELLAVSVLEPQKVYDAFSEMYQRMHALLQRRREELVSVPIYNSRGGIVSYELKSFGTVIEDWLRAMINLKVQDFPHLRRRLDEGEIILQLRRSPSGAVRTATEWLAAYGQEIYNSGVAPAGWARGPIEVLRSSSKSPSCWIISAEFISFPLGRPVKVAFHAPQISLETLGSFALSRAELRSSIEEYATSPRNFRRYPPKVLAALTEPCNCLAFASGYVAVQGRLIPGAGSEKKTDPIAWIADAHLQSQGCIRIDNLCEDFVLSLEEQILDHPIYLIAVIHTGAEVGQPDAHVMRCFYDQYASEREGEPRFIWMQSGGRNELTFVTKPSGELITGIPLDPIQAFCNREGGYSCFLGYYLVSDRAVFISEVGIEARIQ